MRFLLTYPARFRSERYALGFIRDNGLFPIGAQHAQVDESGTGWRVFINTAKPDTVCRYLANHMPGVEWQRSELA